MVFVRTVLFLTRVEYEYIWNIRCKEAIEDVVYIV